MIEAMEINERGMTPDTPTPRTPSPISATGAQPLLVEAKRCEAKAPPKKFNTQARMSVGGKGLLWCKKKLAQAQREVVVISDEDEGEKRQDKEPPAPRPGAEGLCGGQRLGELHEPRFMGRHRS